MKNAKYKFSVVIPIYNTEQYLEETVESVINQTFGFEKNIQIIFVNDGSKDNSKEICLRYKEKYPNNIIYVEQKNAGVSSARNNGMNYIEGEYVNFLDSDDKWDKEAFKEIYKFFKENKNIMIASGRKKFFEAREDYHLLDYKFEETKVVDILKEYQFIQLHITSTFIKSEIAKKYKFNEDLRYGEDASYLNEIILKERYYGVVREALHYYRKRLSETSAVQNKEKSIDWYTKTIEKFYKNLINKSIENYGKVIEYIQYLLMYDIRYRFTNKLPDFLEPELKEKYIDDLKYLLSQIEDYIISEAKNSNSEYKLYALSLKYGKDIRKELEYDDGKLYFNNVLVNKIRANKSIFKIDILEVEDENLVIEGRVQTVFPKKDYEIFILCDEKNKIKLNLTEGKKSIIAKNAFILDKQVIYYYTYKAIIPLKKCKKLNFIFEYKNAGEDKLFIRFGKFAKLSNYSESYYAKGKYILKYSKKSIKVKKNTLKNRLKREIKNMLFLLKKREIKVIFTRLIYFLIHKFYKKEIWLISDRNNMAKDNGEEFFKYVNTVNNKNIKPYFVISKKSEDYKRMKEIGNVIKIKTLKHKLYFMMASKIISSQANDYVINAFGKKERFYKDLENFSFVFLQHGITKEDLSAWLKKFDKNIKLFVTAARKEYDSIVNGNYYYTENEVKLTGFPRFDKLENNMQKSIVIWPTQRRPLVEWNPKEKVNFSYNPYFKDSDCYKFYNGLINDERILKVLKEKGYKMRFALHPLHRKQAKDFKENEYVKVIKESINFDKEFAENALLVTDYSSVAFDFAYLRKKVIYTEFDREEFFKGQVYDKGYFDVEKDGFGPVCYDYESTVQTIIDAVNNDCKIEEEYLKRIDSFYYKFDKDNSKRVYEAILELDR